ncbi:MAG: hypothetical protein ACJ790_09405 [Myxococcaceae bacterium]
MLSPLDAELVTNWAERAVPVDVIARGIRRAAEKALFDARPGEPALRSLRSCKKDVESEIKKHVRLSAGRTVTLNEVEGSTESPDEARGKSLGQYAKQLRKLAKDHPPLAQVLTRLAEEALSDSAPPAELREKRIVTQLLRALPFSDRVKLLKDARALYEGSLPHSAPARKLSRRFHRGAVLRRALDLPAFW